MYDLSYYILGHFRSFFSHRSGLGLMIQESSTLFMIVQDHMSSIPSPWSGVRIPLIYPMPLSRPSRVRN